MASQSPDRHTGARLPLLKVDVPLTAALLAMPAVLWLASLPAQLLLPGVAIAAMAAAAAAAAIGWLTGTDRRAPEATIWDVAGACVLVGVAAGMFSDPEHVSQLFGAAPAAPDQN
jgi:hypothetical protein